MIICTDRIDELCLADPPLIVPYCAEDNKNNPARAQLHLGKLCYCSDVPNKVHDLEVEKEIEIAPNTIFLFETYETVNFPKNLSGRMSLKMGLIQKGLLMPNQTMVDPGYSNVLFGMLYNLSSNPVKLAYKQAITTLEISETQLSAREYDGKMKSMCFDEYVRDRVESSLGYLDNKLRISNEELQKSTKRFSWSVNSWNIILAIIAVLIAIMSLKSNPQTEILEYKMSELQTTVEEQQKQLKEYEERLRTLESGSSDDVGSNQAAGDQK